jgi:phosphoglycerate dehydrogenase-like enzyme
MRVAILDDYQNLALTLADWSRVQARAEVVVFTRNLGPDEAAAALQGFDAICLLRERMPVPASLIAALPDLKLIAITGAQNRTLDLAAAHARGIVVSRTERSGNADFATAELAWGLILSALRHIPREAAGMRAGAWQTTLGEGLAGLTLGLVGLGRLGRRMVPVAKAFGMDVIAWSQNLTAEAAEAAGARRVEKAALFREADVISLHLVLSERTRGVVGAAARAAREHLARPAHRRAGARRGPARAPNRRRGPRRLRHGAPAGGRPAARPRQRAPHPAPRLRRARAHAGLLRGDGGERCRLPRRQADPHPQARVTAIA